MKFDSSSLELSTLQTHIIVYRLGYRSTISITTFFQIWIWSIQIEFIAIFRFERFYTSHSDFELENPVGNHIKRSRRPSTSSTDQSLLDQTDIMDLDRGHNPLDGAQAQGSNSSESF